jgi:hypothetical protein
VFGVLLSCTPAIRFSPSIVDADAGAGCHARLCCLGGGARRLWRHEGIDGLQSLPGRGRDSGRAPGIEFLKFRRGVYSGGVGFVVRGFLVGTDGQIIRPEGLRTTD